MDVVYRRILEDQHSRGDRQFSLDVLEDPASRRAEGVVTAEGLADVGEAAQRVEVVAQQL